MVTFSGVIMGRVQSKRRKVLIVEDDPEVRLLTKIVLEESEFSAALRFDMAAAKIAAISIPEIP